MGFRITSASICNVRSSNLLARPSILIERLSIYSVIMVCIILHINMYDQGGNFKVIIVSIPKSIMLVFETARIYIHI